MKKTIIISALLVLSLAGCKREMASEDNHPFYRLPSDGMTFRAANAGCVGKSTFKNLDIDGQLVWDEHDVLAVYAVNTAAEESQIAGTCVSGLAYIDPAFAGETSAEFKSTLSESQWYDGAASRWFFATYPSIDLSTMQKLQTAGGEDTENPGVYNYYHLLPVYVNDEQEYAAGFRSYHTMISDGGTFQSGETVSFGAFRPATSLIRFRMKTASGSSCRIGEVSFKFGYDWAYDYLQSDSRTSLAGVRLMKVNPGNRTITFDPDLSGYAHESSVSLEFLIGGDSENGGGIEIGSEYSDYYYIAVLPTVSIPDGKEMLLRIEADAYELWEENYKENGYTLMVPAPGTLATVGFEAGKCYSFAITLEDGGLSVGYEGNFVLGSYDINTEWGQEN